VVQEGERDRGRPLGPGGRGYLSVALTPPTGPDEEVT
jgi:hypothetical protein